MKLLEVAPDFVRSQVGVLMTILQFLSNKTKPGAKIPTPNVVNLMNNAGYPFDWRAIEGLKEKYPALDELIGSVDEKFISLGKEEEPEVELPDQTQGNLNTPSEPDMGMNAAPQEPAPTQGASIGNGRSPERATVDKMAARASRF